MCEIQAYLERHLLGTMFLLGELAYAERRAHVRRPDVLSYDVNGEIAGVCGFAREGRCLPHLVDARVIPSMVADIASRRVRFMSGLANAVDQLVGPLRACGMRLAQDECETLCQLEPDDLIPFRVGRVRRATLRDLDLVAELRTSFEAEYFQIPRYAIPPRWAKRIARRYIEDGTYLAEADGEPVSMAAVEVDIPQLSAAAAVYTRRAWRRRGYAKSVVSALAEDAFRTKPLVALTVREGNEAAQRAYKALGFRAVDVYRFVSFRSA
ncbi:MAG: GNAT family N-acetyltransferase [Anaerolineae bacterium]